MTPKNQKQNKNIIMSYHSGLNTLCHNPLLDYPRAHSRLLSPDRRALSPSSRPLSHIKYQNIKVHYQGFLEHPKFQESDQ